MYIEAGPEQPWQEEVSDKRTRTQPNIFVEPQVGAQNWIRKGSLDHLGEDLEVSYDEK